MNVLLQFTCLLFAQLEKEKNSGSGPSPCVIADRWAELFREGR
jgi:hypothetical protein